MDIKEIALNVADSMSNTTIIMPKNEDLIAFAGAIIESYKAELLKEVRGPVAEFKRHPFGDYTELSFSAGYSARRGDKLYTSDQIAAAIAKATKPLEERIKWLQDFTNKDGEVIKILEDQLAKAEQRVAEVTALNPILEILDPARRLFIIANRLELKYPPIYADQPDPTYITKWVWEVRDQFGASVCEAHEWLYQAIDNAEKAISANGASS